MPRPLVFSNGRLLVALDGRLNIRELFYPHVGLYDHLGGQMIRMGVWVGGQFAWMDEPGWHFGLGYEKDSLVSHCEAVHSLLGVSLHIHDCVHPDETAFLRQMKVRNLSHLEQDVRIFFNQDLRIADSNLGLCALYHPGADAMITYRGQFAFLFAGRAQGKGLYGYNAHARRVGGQDGCWWDAEDGELGMNPVCQGAIDSIIGLRLELAPREEDEASYWIVAGRSIEDAERAYSRLRAISPSSHVADAQQSDHSMVLPLRARCADLALDIADFCVRSYLLLKTQIDSEGGILAANDSDIMVGNRAHYSYVWPRDGSLVGMVLDRLGDLETTERYFEYCLRLDHEGRGYFLQKYQSDGAFGATWHPWLATEGHRLPMQEDETALTLLALCRHPFATDSAKRKWRPFAAKMAEAILAFRNPESGLPLPSHDLWEERRGVHTFTVASVVVALEAASDFLGAPVYAQAADEMRKGLLDQLFDKQTGGFLRMITEDGEADPTPDSSTLLAGIIGALPGDHPSVVSNLKFIERTLTVPGPIGGICRYPHDWYWKQHGLGSNPWVVTTMWLAQAKMAARQSAESIEEAEAAIRWAMGLADPTGVLPEQFHPTTGAHLSVSPLTWSHAEVIKTALDCLDLSRKLELRTGN